MEIFGSRNESVEHTSNLSEQTPESQEGGGRGLLCGFEPCCGRHVAVEVIFAHSIKNEKGASGVHIGILMMP